MIELGQTVQCRITGFTGVATGRVEYITGCNQVLVTPKAKPDGSLNDSAWFDEQRLTFIGSDRITLDNGTTPGFDKQAPIW